MLLYDKINGDFIPHNCRHCEETRQCSKNEYIEKDKVVRCKTCGREVEE